MTPTETLVANAIAYELNLGHADIRPHIERAAARAIAIVRETAMTPTPEQIEAIRYELPMVASAECHPDDCKKWLRQNWELLLALTAAAGVKLAENLVASATEEDAKTVHYPLGRAAAGVGDNNRYMEGYVEGCRKTRAEIETATIERCAQVAEETGDMFTSARIAAAIRALKSESKDKP